MTLSPSEVRRLRSLVVLDAGLVELSLKMRDYWLAKGDRLCADRAELDAREFSAQGFRAAARLFSINEVSSHVA